MIAALCLFGLVYVLDLVCRVKMAPVELVIMALGEEIIIGNVKADEYSGMFVC